MQGELFTSLCLYNLSEYLDILVIKLLMPHLLNIGHPFSSENARCQGNSSLKALPSKLSYPRPVRSSEV